MAATGLELCKGHFIAKAVLPFLDLARQVRKKVTPDWGQVSGKGLFGVTLDMDGCYWFGALQGPLHCKTNSAFPWFCPTSEKQSNPGFGPSHGKGLVRGYFRHGWLLLVWSSARATSLQQQFCHSWSCPTSEEQSNPGLRPSHGKMLVRGYFRHGWLAATGFELCKGHFIANTGNGLFGVTLDIGGCYWIGALQGPLQCKSSSAFPRPCPTSEEESNPGLGPSHGKGLVRGYFGHGWLLLVWSSASTTSLQKQFCLSLTLHDK